ncbi:hypothetical protein AKO1_006119, partial [Acrasis kona]
MEAFSLVGSHKNIVLLHKHNMSKVGSSHQHITPDVEYFKFLIYSAVRSNDTGTYATIASDMHKYVPKSVQLKSITLKRFRTWRGLQRHTKDPKKYFLKYIT